MPFVIPPPASVRHLGDGTPEEISYIKKTYLMAQFLQRPNDQFEFDHIMWEVVFRSIPHPLETGLLIKFKATTEGILALYNCYCTFNIPEAHDWDHCVELAEPIVQLDNQYGPTMARVIRQYGLDMDFWPKPVGTILKVNWGRDGF